MSHTLQIIGIACLTAAAPVAAASDDDAAPAAERSSAADATAIEPGTAVAASGLRIVMDPETGEIVENPTARQLEELSERGLPSKRRSIDELRSFSLPGGGEGVFLDGWAHQALAIEVTPDGKVKTVCAHGDRHGNPEPVQPEELEER